MKSLALSMGSREHGYQTYSSMASTGSRDYMVQSDRSGFVGYMLTTGTERLSLEFESNHI
jgi:hypothetical protein